MLLMGIVGLLSVTPVAASEHAKEELSVKSIVFDHIKDAYSWHITSIGGHHISVPLPVIVRGQSGEWEVFSASHLEHSADGTYKGFYISRQEGAYNGRIVEKDLQTGAEVRPLDLSLTKTAVGVWLSALLLLVLVMSCARWAKRNGRTAPKGFTGFMELFIMDINDSLIKACVGEKYARYSPYLLTVFFFIFLNNLLGLVPIFPGGVNVTGNITITFFLACCTFLVTNLFGSKEYYKEVFWPDVPHALKPIMIPIEIVGMFTKPFALMVRLFANIMAGHTIILCLVSIIFVTATLGVALFSSMTAVSVLFSLFMNALELLVAYIQAYVFTMLSAVFIGLSVQEHH
jgi:F-type H+-transporting ATPase subunit a